MVKASYYQLQGPRFLRLCDEDLGGSLQPGEVLALTEFSAVSTGTELAAWLGKPPLRPSANYPRLMGYCNVAEVVGLGSSTNGLQIGDYILTHQSHRTAFRCAVNEILLSVQAPTQLDRKKLAVVYLYHLGYSALLRSEYMPGHAVAVIGFGALGLATCQLLHAFGSSPVVFTGRPAMARADLPSGVSVLAKSMPEVRDLTNLTGMDGFDIVVSTSDNWDDFLLAQRLSRSGGNIVCLGFPGRGLPPPTFNPLDSQYFYDKQLTLRHCGHTPVDAPPSDVRFALKRNLRYLFGLLRDGRTDARPLIRFEARFDTLAEVYDQLSGMTRPGFSALLRWRD